jgi:chromate transporter
VSASGGDQPSPAASAEPVSPSLTELAKVFLKLGTIAFGGPAAHIAMMRSEIVERRRWLTVEEFLDLLGAASLLPGPTSTEAAIFIGFLKRRWVGLLVAGACFILPAALIVTAIAWAYVRFGHLPEVGGVLYGVKPVIIAVVLQALVGLGQTAAKSWLLAALGVAGLAASFLGVNPLAVLFGSGLLMAIIRWTTKEREHGFRPILVLIAICCALTLIPLWISLHPSESTRPSLGALFLFFLKVGSVLFGSGYVLLAFLRNDLVVHLHWLTQSQLLDSIAVGQVTPGPVFTTATFIGYILAGPAGAAVATLAIFLPGFFFVGVTGPYLRRLRQSPVASAFLDGVNIAAVALMAVVTYQLGRAALVDIPTVAIGLVSALLLFRFKLNSVWLVLAGAIAGLILRR